MRRRKPDTIEVQQMKAQAREEKHAKQMERWVACIGGGGGGGGGLHRGVGCSRVCPPPLQQGSAPTRETGS